MQRADKTFCPPPDVLPRHATFLRDGHLIKKRRAPRRNELTASWQQDGRLMATRRAPHSITIGVYTKRHAVKAPSDCSVPPAVSGTTGTN